MKLPPTNASVTKIEESIYNDDDFGNPGPTFISRWSGEAPAYLRTRTVVIEASGGALPEMLNELSIPSSLATVETGWRVTFIRGGVARTLIADQVEDQADYGFLKIISKENPE